MLPVSFLDPRLPDRFWSKCIPEPNTGCWLWFAGHNREGYGRIQNGGKYWLAHRLSYARLVGPLIDGMQLDQRGCQNQSCCNPAHLEQVTGLVNWSRGNAPSRRALESETCKHGHPYDEKNGHVRVRDGKVARVCRRCRHISKRKAMQKRRADVIRP